VTVPNAMVTNTAIDNLGARRFRRYKTTLQLTYDTPAEKVQAFCEGVRAIVAALPGMRKDFYMVEFHGFGAHSLDVLLYCFMQTPDWATELRVRTNLNLEILRLSHELGVSFAFPTQTLHIETMPGAPTRDGAGRVDLSQIADVVRAFGPSGAKALASGFTISEGFDAGARTGVRGDADADG
jgi:MscS family membrane protein